MTKRVVVNASVANIGIQPGGARIHVQAILHHRSQKSLAVPGQVSHQQTHRGSRHLRIKCNFSCNGDCRCFPPVAAGYLNNVRVLCKEGCEEKFTAETEQMLSRYEPALEFG